MLLFKDGFKERLVKFETTMCECESRREEMAKWKGSEVEGARTTYLVSTIPATLSQLGMCRQRESMVHGGLR